MRTMEIVVAGIVAGLIIAAMIWSGGGCVTPIGVKYYPPKLIIEAPVQNAD